MKRSSARSRIIQVVLLAGVLPCLVSLTASFLFGKVCRVHEPLHECWELAGTCIALTVAMLLWLRSRHEKDSPHLLWVAAALVAMGLMDGVHAVVPFGVAWSWLRHGATLVGGLLFALVWLPLPAFVVRRRQSFMLMVTVLAVAGAAAVWRWSNLLPAPFEPSGYSLSVKAANALGGLGFLVAAVFFLRRCLRGQQEEDLVFASQTVLFGTASLLFGFSHAWAADWWVWHAFRLLAYGTVLAVAYQVVATLYQQLGWR